MLRALLAAALAASALPPPAALAQSPAEPIEEGVREQSCRMLLAGTVGLPDPVSPSAPGALPATWEQAPAGLLPPSVLLRGPSETFNRFYEFAVRAGDVYAHVRGDAGPWRRMPLPPCFAGRAESISADDDEVIVLDTARRIHTLDNALKDPHLFNWSSRWGTPFWTGLGFSLPGPLAAWSWSVISPAEDETWVDPAGNAPMVGSGKVSHIWGLQEDGLRLTFWDPWLPPDSSYEMCGPHRGRFRSVNLSASGSLIFVVGAHGDLFTRTYDFDISGHDPLFFSYSYADQRGKGPGAPIQLPAEPWTRQPKIAGRITSAISVHKTGRRSVHRILRVEGVHNGRTGYFERDVADPAPAGWTFHATDRPLAGALIDNPVGDTSLFDLGPGEDRRYAMEDGELRDFNVYCSPARIRVRGEDFLLHHLDGIRQQARARGLDDTPRSQWGALEGPKGTFRPVTVHATRTEVVLDEPRWWFRLSDPQPLTSRRCLPERSRVGTGGIEPVALRSRRFDLLTELPAPRRGKRVWRWCVDGGGRLSVVIAEGRVVLLHTTGRSHSLGRGISPGTRMSALRRAYPQRRALGGGAVRLSPESSRIAIVSRGRVVALATAERAPARVLRARLRAVGQAQTFTRARIDFLGSLPRRTLMKARARSVMVEPRGWFTVTR
jgi:hypothetical protein